MTIRNNLLRAWYYTSRDELFFKKHSTFYKRVEKECARTLFGSQDLTEQEIKAGYGSPIGTCDSWGTYFADNLGNWAYDLGQGARCLTYAYSGLMLIPESIVILLKESTYALNLYLNDCIISAALAESSARIENLSALTILKILAMTTHFLTCLLSFCIHFLTRLPENLCRFTMISAWILTSSLSLSMSKVFIFGTFATVVGALISSVLGQCIGDIKQTLSDINHPQLNYHYPLYNAWRHVKHTFLPMEQTQLDFYQDLVIDPIETISTELTTFTLNN
ncbi:MAG: hypothetical protein ABSF18_01810 [Gammaproteobacteria bacterium]|jgi:hypothetical protein